MNIKPIGERVLVKPLAEQRLSTAVREGVVIAISKDDTVQVRDGEVVVYRNVVGDAFTLEGEEYVFVSLQDILGRIEEE